MQPTRLPKKKDVALQLLEQATVFVHLDPRGESVRVPPWFKRQPQLVLQIGLNMPVPIPDLHVDDNGLSCTLSFNRSPHFCSVPWAAIYALVGESGRGMVWPDDVPPEVAAQMQGQPAPKRRTHLRAVDEAGQALEPTPGGSSEPVPDAAAVPAAPSIAAVPQPAGAGREGGARKKKRARRAKPELAPAPAPARADRVSP